MMPFLSPEPADALPLRQRHLLVSTGQVLRHTSGHRGQVRPVWTQSGLSETVAHVEGNRLTGPR